MATLQQRFNNAAASGAPFFVDRASKPRPALFLPRTQRALGQSEPNASWQSVRPKEPAIFKGDRWLM